MKFPQIESRFVKSWHPIRKCRPCYDFSTVTGAMRPVFALDKLSVWPLCKATVLQLIISPFLLRDGATVRKP